MSTREQQPEMNEIIARLAVEFQVPVEYVAALFELERATLADSAQVTNFLDIFATRNVQHSLRARRTPDADADDADV